ncbi:MAG: Cna B-type domain-containing protein, partial [Coriobacteriales bacterium]
TTSGTRTYTIVEVDEGAADVAYDGSVYTATVEVADADGDGTLDAPTVTYYDGDGNEVPAAAFDNTVITRTSVSFTKDWVGDAGESATVRLMCSTDGGDAEDTGLSVTVDGTADDLATDSATGAEYGEDAAWHGTFQNLVASDGDHTYSYALVEDAVDGYSSSSSGDASEGYVFTNTELTSVSGTKVWDDSDDQDGLRPDSVTVSLLQGSTVVDTQTVTADSDWSFSFGDLAKYDSDGNEYAYTVEEASVPDGYTSSVTENSDGTFTITNTHTPETTSVSVSKSWVGPAGTSATFALYADNVDTGQTLTLTADTGWSGSFDGLAKYNNGTEIAYTVSETGMGGVDSSNYSTTVSGDASSGYAFTNTNTETVTVHVQKNWVSLMDEESVTVRLIRNGVSTDTTITITADTDTASGDSYDGWSNDFTDLPKYDTNGDEIVYTVVEEGVYWSNNSTNYREYYGCTANYNTSGNTITCALWNEFGGGDG